MTKYLFLLGFFVFSISFLSGCKMSDFYSAPVTNADSAPVADTDSAPAADTDSAPVADTDSAPVADTDSAPVVADNLYKGVIYQNNDASAVSCDWGGIVKLIRFESEHNMISKVPDGCEEGAFSSFILFSEVKKGSSDVFRYVHSFISSDNGYSWESAYLRVNKRLGFKNCNTSDEDCQKNLLAYEKYTSDSPFDGKTSNRAPDSIKEKVVE